MSCAVLLEFYCSTLMIGVLFVFLDACSQYLWRIGEQGLYAGFPYEITRVWSQLPENFTHIDAVYENKDRKIVFFVGKSIESID